MAKRGMIALLPMSVALAGCSRAPSIDILGSFFPVWMLSIAIAIVLAALVRMVLVRKGLETEVGPLALFYPALVVLFSTLLWLIFFR